MKLSRCIAKIDTQLDFEQVSSSIKHFSEIKFFVENSASRRREGSDLKGGPRGAGAPLVSLGGPRGAETPKF